MSDPTITPAKLLRLAPGLGAAASVHADALEAARALADLSTPLRVAHFMAQVLTETGGLHRLVENLHYTDPVRLEAIFHNARGPGVAEALIAKGGEAIANCVYAGRNGNGDEASGDGFRFLGRGYLQITGRANYAAFGAKVGMDLISHPELLEAPVTAAQASMKYWAASKINIAADADSVTAVTRAINPALAGIEDRKAWLARTRAIWP